MAFLFFLHWNVTDGSSIYASCISSYSKYRTSEIRVIILKGLAYSQQLHPEWSRLFSICACLQIRIKFGTILDHFGGWFGTLLGKGRFGKWLNMFIKFPISVQQGVHIGTIRDETGLNGIFLDLQGPFGTTRDHSGPSGTFRDCSEDHCHECCLMKNVVREERKGQT